MRVPRSKMCCRMSGKSIVLPRMRVPPLSIRWSSSPAQRSEDFGRGWQAWRVGYIPAIDDLCLGIDHQHAAAKHVFHARGVGVEQTVSISEVAIEVAQQN